MKFFIATFDKLLADRRRTGYIDLVAPVSFEQQVEFERRARDVEEGLLGAPARIRMSDIPDVPSHPMPALEVTYEPPSRAHAMFLVRSVVGRGKNKCSRCQSVEHKSPKCPKRY